jgi:hypothetical protein
MNVETKLERKCPTCERIIKYSNKYNLNAAQNNNRDCKSCSTKKNRPEGYKEKLSERFKGKNNPMWGKTGSLNPFYGKKHTEETKRKIIENRNYSSYKTEKFRKKISDLTKGKKNPMYGKTVYDVWFKKYGKKIADEKMEELKLKQSFLNSGEKNKMFGRPSPKNSGNGICGRYKNWFFRSLLELSYMINVIERFNLVWETGEKEKYKIEYEFNGVNRNYFPDFIIENKYIVELKPKKLQKTLLNQSKFLYAEKFCLENGYKFKVTNIKNINKKELLLLIDNGLVNLTNKWKHKIKPNNDIY